MLLLSRESEYLLEAVLVKFVVRDTQKALNRFLGDTGSPARKPERHIAEKSKVGVASDMCTAFPQQHSVLFPRGNNSSRNGTKKSPCLRAWQVATSFNSRISIFAELQKAPQPLPSDTSRTFDAASPTTISPFRVTDGYAIAPSGTHVHLLERVSRVYYNVISGRQADSDIEWTYEV